MDATLLLRGAWVGVGWDVNVHLHLHTTWMLCCCYVGHGLGWDWIYSWMWRRNCKGDVWAAMPALFHWDRDCCKPAAKTSSAANGGVTLFYPPFYGATGGPNFETKELDPPRSGNFCRRFHPWCSHLSVAPWRYGRIQDGDGKWKGHIRPYSMISNECKLR